jgi:hypothetical protein
MGITDSYILKGKKFYPATYLEFARWREIPGRVRVALTQLPNEKVSTVFLGLDHQWVVGSPPILFETMIFGGSADGYQCRYNTYEQAAASHRQVVKNRCFLSRLKHYKRIACGASTGFNTSPESGGSGEKV